MRSERDLPVDASLVFLEQVTRSMPTITAGQLGVSGGGAVVRCLPAAGAGWIRLSPAQENTLGFRSAHTIQPASVVLQQSRETPGIVKTSGRRGRPDAVGSLAPEPDRDERF
jgi:hypothetical protein